MKTVAIILTKITSTPPLVGHIFKMDPLPWYTPLWGDKCKCDRGVHRCFSRWEVGGGVVLPVCHGLFGIWGKISPSALSSWKFEKQMQYWYSLFFWLKLCQKHTSNDYLFFIGDYKDILPVLYLLSLTLGLAHTLTPPPNPYSPRYKPETTLVCGKYSHTPLP